MKGVRLEMVGRTWRFRGCCVVLAYHQALVRVQTPLT